MPLSTTGGWGTPILAGRRVYAIGAAGHGPNKLPQPTTVVKGLSHALHASLTLFTFPLFGGRDVGDHRTGPVRNTSTASKWITRTLLFDLHVEGQCKDRLAARHRKDAPFRSPT